MITKQEVSQRLRSCDTDDGIIAELMEIVKDLSEKLDAVEKMAQDTAQYVDENKESGRG